MTSIESCLAKNGKQIVFYFIFSFINSLFPLLQAAVIVFHVARRPPHRDFPLHQVATKRKRSVLSTCTASDPSVPHYADHQHCRKRTSTQTHTHAKQRIIFMRCYTPVTTNTGSQCSLIHTPSEKTAPCNRGITMSD